jgi:hypothetical protein
LAVVPHAHHARVVGVPACHDQVEHVQWCDRLELSHHRQRLGGGWWRVGCSGDGGATKTNTEQDLAQWG